MISLRRLLPILSVAVVSALSAACACKNGTCIKEPPCGPCENPCCLTPVDLKSRAAKSHALPGGPTVYSYDEKTYILFSEKGLAEFQKDPAVFEEKAIRSMKGGVTYRTDINVGEEIDLAPYASRARPFVK